MASLEERIKDLEAVVYQEEQGLDPLVSVLQRLGNIEDELARLKTDVGAAVGVNLRG